MIQKYTILGEVRGQGRPRATTRGRHAGMYKDKKDVQYEDNIRSQIVSQGVDFIQAKVPITISIIAHITRPQAHFNSKGEIFTRFKEAEPTSKPDGTNILKAIEDACNSVLWADDSAITHFEFQKIYGPVGKIELEVMT